MTWKTAIFAALLGLVSSQAAAAPDRLNVDFGFFPQGTTCDIYNTTGRVSLRTGREIEFQIRGDTANVSFICRQPDGRAFRVDIGPLLPQGSQRLVSVQVNQDNHAIVLWDQGGLMRRQVPGVLQWQ